MRASAIRSTGWRTVVSARFDDRGEHGVVEPGDGDVAAGLQAAPGEFLAHAEREHVAHRDDRGGRLGEVEQPARCGPAVGHGVRDRPHDQRVTRGQPVLGAGRAPAAQPVLHRADAVPPVEEADALVAEGDETGDDVVDRGGAVEVDPRTRLLAAGGPDPAERGERDLAFGEPAVARIVVHGVGEHERVDRLLRDEVPVGLHVAVARGEEQHVPVHDLGRVAQRVQEAVHQRGRRPGRHAVADQLGAAGLEAAGAAVGPVTQRLDGGQHLRHGARVDAVRRVEHIGHRLPGHARTGRHVSHGRRRSHGRVPPRRGHPGFDRSNQAVTVVHATSGVKPPPIHPTGELLGIHGNRPNARENSGAGYRLPIPGTAYPHVQPEKAVFAFARPLVFAFGAACAAS